MVLVSGSSRLARSPLLLGTVLAAGETAKWIYQYVFAEATLTTTSIFMRLNLMAGGRFLSVLPTTLLQHRSNKAWLRALRVDLGDSSGSIAAITIKDRRHGGAVKLFSEISRAVCKDFRS